MFSSSEEMLLVGVDGRCRWKRGRIFTVCQSWDQVTDKAGGVRNPLGYCWSMRETPQLRKCSVGLCIPFKQKTSSGNNRAFQKGSKQAQNVPLVHPAYYTKLTLCLLAIDVADELPTLE